mmetsp:Transcript_16255/g.24088  ORF Transcript_16255/g.24088 Transcript_16255/m.24088 type:complete len:108 (+) Transcript_16255:913-1236(+)
MSPSVIASNDFEMPEDDANLREVVIAMICARDAMDVNKEEEENACFVSLEENFMIKTEYIISELREMRGLAECIASITETAVGEKSAAQLRSELYGQTIFKRRNHLF